ncbi:MAG: beta-ketoacyl-[acyl-carrier-protein] synthase II [Verrucomicrobia bacterium]|nr:beta-ketoacyl-[acyl-carrier-protein] synthase II [Verrucomicrobiota bacterium]
MRRVVITGMGVVSPLGCDLNVVWDRLTAGKSGIRKVTKFDASKLDAKIAGEVAEFNPDNFVGKKEQRRMDDFAIFAMAASKLAVTDSGLDFSKEDTEKVGVIIGSGIGGFHTIELQHSVLRDKGPTRSSPFMIPQTISNMAGALVAIEFGLKGPNFCVVTACASALHSMGQSMRLIQAGDADVILSGGAEAGVCELSFAGFCALKALCSTHNEDPEKASRPFDAGRSGFVMGEGSAILVLEELEHARKRGARIYCELAGFGMSCDAYHMTAPDESAAGPARAMKAAMKDAAMNPENIDYVNAHGTSTELNDKCETKAIKLALGEERARKTMISSTKSMTGHLLGAAGGIESIVCAMAMHTGVVPPTINYETPDPYCDLDYVPNTARHADVKACLNNSFGFGGHNACVLLRKM